MFDRDDMRNLAIGSYAVTNPTAKFEDLKLFSEGAIWALDYIQRQKRKEKYRQAFDVKPAPTQIAYQGAK